MRNPRPIIVQPEDETIKLIPLTQGQVTMVDAHRYEHLSQWNWYAQWNDRVGGFYAARRDRLPSGKRVVIYMHRYILGLNAGDVLQGDHREPSETLDNRDKNLRISTSKDQKHNQRIRRTNKSGFKGVYKVVRLKTKPWASRYELDGKKIFLGYFETAQLAHEARWKEIQKHHGEFARIA